MALPGDYTPVVTDLFHPIRMTLSRARDGGCHITRRGAERWARRTLARGFDVQPTPTETPGE